MSEPSPSPRPGHARVLIEIWSSRAAQPMFERPDYGASIELGADLIEDFTARAARLVGRMLMSYGHPGCMNVEADASNLARDLVPVACADPTLEAMVILGARPNETIADVARRVRAELAAARGNREDDELEVASTLETMRRQA